MLSPCCSERIRVEFHEEYYHCCDDGYPLKVPYLVCTKCISACPGRAGKKP